jgi:hypothetical protein
MGRIIAKREYQGVVAKQDKGTGLLKGITADL